MTNANKAELFILIDRSGSMSNIMETMISSINALLKEQRETVKKELNVTVACFDDATSASRNNTYTVGPLDPLTNTIPVNHYVYHSKKIGLTTDIIRERSNIFTIQDINQYEVSPRGCTALNDAVCDCIDYLGSKFAQMNEKDRPSKVMFMTITDGGENASRLYKTADVKKRINTQRETYKWEFIYLGANQDAWGVADQLGVGSAGTYTASAAGVHTVIDGASYIAANYLAGNFTGCMRAATLSTSGVIAEDDTNLRSRIAATAIPHTNP